MEEQTLAAATAAAPLPLLRALEVMVGVARGIAAAHEHGLIHGNLGPQNVFVLASRGCKVSDFGLMPIVERAHFSPDKCFVLTGRTAFGAQYHPACLDEPAESMAADVYALGVMLFEVVAHRLPYPSSDLFDHNRRRMQESVPRLRALVSDAPVALDQLASSMMSVQPSDRPTIRDVALELDAVVAALRFASSGR